MYAELQIAAKHIAEGRTDAPLVSNASLMIVESNEAMQNVLREKLKKTGYRVLLTNDPHRPVNWFRSQRTRPADCVVFSTQELKEEALEAFNEFGQHPETRDVPAILMLGEQQNDFQQRARLASHRVALAAPLRLKEFRETIERIVAK